MTRHYGQPIAVTAAESGTGQPAAFHWRGVRYRVREILAIWHLRDRWWEATPPADAPTTSGASDRHYYRLRCVASAGSSGDGNGLLCDVYYDAARDGWVLDRVHD